MKIKLKSGDREIEVEGTKAEIDQALSNWWDTSNTQTTGNTNTLSANKKRTQGRKKSQSYESAAGNGNSSEFDPISLANAIKEHKDYNLYEEHILHKSSILNKILLICANETNDLTSGEITKTLKALDVKIDPGNLSNALKANSGKFLATGARKKGGTVPKYRLTSKSRTDFEKWISEQTKP